LAKAGCAISPEAGRGVIKDQAAIEGQALPWSDPGLYAELMPGWDMRSHHLARRRSGSVFFDRSVLDTIGYLRLLGRTVPVHMDKAATMFRYNRRVFIAPPWPEIFEQDSERRQTLDEATRTYEAMVMTYRDYGYELEELPRVSVDERVEYIAAQLPTAFATRNRP
jgi:predicted ATPase